MKHFLHTIQVLLIMAYAFCTIQSCQEDINIDLNDQNQKRLVVDGRITDENKPQKVRLTYTANYFSDQKAPPVLGATVFISEEGTGNEYPMILADSTFGYYTSQVFAGRVGEDYTLHVRDGSNSYTATSLLKQVAQMDSIDYIYHYDNYEERGYYTIRMSAFEPAPIGDIYMFYLYVNDTLYNNKLSRTPYADDLFYNNTYLDTVTIFDLPQEEIIQKTNRIKLFMLSISKAEYDYINAFITETYDNGSIFSGPPANIPSNIINNSGGPDGVGFFGASAVSVGKTTLTKQHDDATNDPDYIRKL